MPQELIPLTTVKTPTLQLDTIRRRHKIDRENLAKACQQIRPGADWEFRLCVLEMAPERAYQVETLTTVAEALTLLSGTYIALDVLCGRPLPEPIRALLGA